MKSDLGRRLPRDLYIAAGARAVAMLGSMVAATALLLDLHGRGAGVWAVAGVLVANTVPIVVLAPVVGVVVDRYDSRTLIVWCGLWQAGSCFLLAFVSDPLVVLPLVSLNAMGTAVINPVFLTLTRLMVPDSQLAAASSLQQGTNVLAMLAGPAVSGMLTGLTGGATVPLLLNAALFLATSGAGLLIGTRRRPPAGPVPKAREGITVLFTDRPIAAVAILTILLVLVVHMAFVAQVFLVRDTFGASELTFGLLQATQTVGMLAGIAVARRLDTVARILVGSPVAAAVLSAAIMIMGLIQSLPAVFALHVVWGIGASVVSVSLGTMLLLRTPAPAIGRALASFHALNRTAALAAYGLGGLALGLVSPAGVYVLSGVGTLIAVLTMIPLLHRAWRAELGQVTVGGSRTPGSDSLSDRR